MQLSPLTPTALVAFLVLCVMPSAAMSSPAASGPNGDVRVFLFDSGIEFPALPGETVTASLTKPSGATVQAMGQGVDFAQWPIWLGFTGPNRDTSLLTPGDVISIMSERRGPMAFTLPPLRAVINATEREIIGFTLPNTHVSLEMALLDFTDNRHTPLGEWSSRSDQDGTFSLALPESTFESDSALVGTVSIALDNNVRVLRRIAEYSLQIEDQGTTLQGTGSSGSMLSGELLYADGSKFILAPRQLFNSRENWYLQLPRPFEPHCRATIAFTLSDDPSEKITQTFSFDIPAFHLDFDSITGQASGHTRPNSHIDIIGSSLLGQRLVTNAVGNSAGEFQAAVVPPQSLRDGWLIEAEVWLQDRISLSVATATESLLVGVHTTSLFGTGTESTTYEMNVLDGSGKVKVANTDVSSDGTTFKTLLPRSMSFEPGDRISVSAAAGDPRTFLVPPLDSHFDSERLKLSGRTIPGTLITVDVLSAVTVAQLATTANILGEYNIDLSSLPGIDESASGIAIIRDNTGNGFYSEWGAINLSVSLNEGTAVITAPADSPFTVRIRDRANQLVSEVSERTFPRYSFGFASRNEGRSIELLDAARKPVDISPGWHVEFESRGVTRTFEAPPLTAEIDVLTDQIAGNTIPNGSILMEWSGPSIEYGSHGPQRTMSDGTFTIALSGTVDLRAYDKARVTVIQPHFRTSKVISASGMVLDISSASIKAQLKPSERYVIAIVRSGQFLWQGLATTDAQGRLEAALRTSDSDPLPGLVPGDVVSIAPELPDGGRIEVTNPELDLHRREDGQVEGHLTPGHSMTVLVDPRFLENERQNGPPASSSPRINADGTFLAPVIPNVPTRPGMQMTARMRNSEGNYVVKSTIVPIAAVEWRGSDVCGYSDAPMQVSAQLRDANGSEAGRGDSQPAGTDRGFRIPLRRRDGSHAVMVPGQQVFLNWLNARGLRQEEITVPAIELTWRQRDRLTILSGKVPPGTKLYVSHIPFCGGSGWISRGRFVEKVVSQSTHGFGLSFDRLGRGEQVDLLFNSVLETWAFRTFRRPLLSVFVDSPRLQVLSSPWDTIELTLAGFDGSRKATVSDDTDENGMSSVSWNSGAGTARNEIGDRIVGLVGGESVDLVVGPLAFDWSPGNPIVVSTSSGQIVEVQIRIANAPDWSGQFGADSQGKFVFDAAHIPPRAAWTIADIRAVRIVAVLDNDHQLVTESENYDLTQTPSKNVRAVFIPWSLRR